MTASASPRKGMLKIRDRRQIDAQRAEKEAAARYERALTGGLSKAARAGLYRELAAGLPRDQSNVG